MSEKLANYLEMLVYDFVEIADYVNTTNQFSEHAFEAFVDCPIEKMREFRKSGQIEDDIIDSIIEYVNVFYDIIINMHQFDKIEFDSLMGAFIDEMNRLRLEVELSSTE